MRISVSVKTSIEAIKEISAQVDGEKKKKMKNFYRIFSHGLDLYWSYVKFIVCNK